MLSFIQGLHLIISMMLLFILLKYYKSINHILTKCQNCFKCNTSDHSNSDHSSTTHKTTHKTSSSK